MTYAYQRLPAGADAESAPPTPAYVEQPNSRGICGIFATAAGALTVVFCGSGAAAEVFADTAPRLRADEPAWLQGKRPAASSTEESAKKRRATDQDHLRHLFGENQGLGHAPTTTRMVPTHWMNMRMGESYECEHEVQSGYFQGVGRDGARIRPMMDFHNWVKDRLYGAVINEGDAVLELAGGRGGDMWKLDKRKVREIFLADADSDALTEAWRRWMYREPERRRHSATLNTKAIDLGNKCFETFRTQDKKPFEVVSCQMAIHYFFKEESSFESFYSVVLRALAPGGCFLFTVFNADRVLTLLNETGQWRRPRNLDESRMLEIREKIVERNVSNVNRTPSVFGQEIEVFLETIGDHPEFLVNLTWLFKRIEPDFKVVEHGSFKKLFDEYPGRRTLSDCFKPFSFLYDYVILQKKNEEISPPVKRQRSN